MNFHDVEFESSFAFHHQLPVSDLPEIAFSGRSNVGKSSMINRLLGRKAIARVSQTPGKTATVNFFRVDNIRFADLPGYGYAKVSKQEKRRWGDLVEGYFMSGRNLGLVVQLIDMRHPPTSDDQSMISFLIECKFPFIIVLTKQDKLSLTQQQQRMDAFMEEIPCADQVTMIPFSAKNGTGVDQVRSVLTQISDSSTVEKPGRKKHSQSADCLES